MYGWLFSQLLSGTDAQAGCSSPSDLVAVQASAAAVADAFQAQDLAGMQSAHAESLALLACLREPISVPVAAQIHETLALAAFTAGQREQVLAELYAAHQLNGTTLITGAVVDGHPLLQLSAQARAQPPGAGAPVPAPAREQITVGGITGGVQAPGASAVVQRYKREQVVDTTLLAPGEPLPAARWPVQRTALLSAAGVAAIGSGILYGRSWQSHNAFWDTGPGALPDSALEAQLQQTNRQAGAAAVLAGSAAALGITAVLLW